MTKSKSTKPFVAGKKFSKKEIAAAVANWQSQQRLTRDAPPSMVGSLPVPPTQWMDCMQIWMQAYYICMAIDMNNVTIAQKQSENGMMLTTLMGLITSINACVAGHQV